MRLIVFSQWDKVFILHVGYSPIFFNTYLVVAYHVSSKEQVGCEKQPSQKKQHMNKIKQVYENKDFRFFNRTEVENEREGETINWAICKDQKTVELLRSLNFVLSMMENHWSSICR